jgi:hypothetical protein
LQKAAAKPGPKQQPVCRLVVQLQASIFKPVCQFWYLPASSRWFFLLEQVVQICGGVYIQNK